MSFRVIENENLKIMIDDLGAELISIFDKVHEREIIWQKDERFWPRATPILFPSVGKVFGGHYLYDGQYYEIGQHGFARDMVMECISETEDSVTHRLCATEETKKSYPFDFILEVTHKLQAKTVTVMWKVINCDTKQMYFTIGAHPGFNIPVNENVRYSDYKLLFEGDRNSLEYVLLDETSGTAMPDKTCVLELADHKLQLTDHMFDHDALVFDHTQIEKVSILHPDGDPYITMIAKDFPSFGIWAKPGAPYICLEPWCGRCDNYGFAEDISKKANINVLKPSEIFEKKYDMIIE